MHFLKQVIETPILDDPAKNHLNVHRHFYRYSRGVFIGPALKISKTSAKITLKGSHEYEDLILELVVKSIPNSNQEFEIKGKLITGEDISNIISDLKFNWTLEKKMAQVQGKKEKLFKNFTADILDVANRNQLLEAVEKLRKNSYLLLSFNVNPSCKISTKKRLPQPSKKKPEADNVSDRINFCSGILENTKKNNQIIIEECSPDFKNDLSTSWKTITITNTYKIKDIEIPKKVSDSRLMRIMAIRKGNLIRTADIDGDIREKQYNIVV